MRPWRRIGEQRRDGDHPRARAPSGGQVPGEPCRRTPKPLAVDSACTVSEADAERVLLAGASGGTGKRALVLLSASPLPVRALTSSPGKVERLERLGADEVVVGDLFDPAATGRAVDGCDVVISAVGTRPIDVHRGGPFVDGEGNANLADAAADADVEAFVMVSALGVGDERPGPMGRLFRLAVGPTIRAKGRAEAAIRAAGLRYTILRPGMLTPGGPSADVVAAEAGAGLWGVIPRTDVARLAVAAPFTPEGADRTLEVVRNPLLRERGFDVDWQLPNRS